MSKSKVADVSIDVVPVRAILRAFGDGLEKQYSDDTALVCPEETLAQQQFADDSDPNTIMAKFAKTGDISLLNPGNTVPRYGDFTSVEDYQTSLNTVIAAQDAFDSLDAQIRARFKNDPAVLMEFLDDEANREEAVKLGLVSAAPAASETINASAGGVASAASSAAEKNSNPPAAPQ